MKSSLFFILTLASLTFMSSSCGVIFGGSRYYASINVKDHPNAEIYVDESKIGSGKANGLYPRNQRLKVQVKEEGCEPKTQVFERAFRTGNFILSVLS